MCLLVWRQEVLFLIGAVSRLKLSWFGHACRHDALLETYKDRQKMVVDKKDCTTPVEQYYGVDGQASVNPAAHHEWWAVCGCETRRY